MKNYIKQTVQEQLKTIDGFELLDDTLVSYKNKEDFQFCIDLVDMETGDVFSYIGTEGHSEVQAVNVESLNAYKSNTIMSVELN